MGRGGRLDVIEDLRNSDDRDTGATGELHTGHRNGDVSSVADEQIDLGLGAQLDLRRRRDEDPQRRGSLGGACERARQRSFARRPDDSQIVGAAGQAARHDRGEPVRRLPLNAEQLDV